MKTDLPPSEGLRVCCWSGPSVLVGHESPVPRALLSFLTRGLGRARLLLSSPAWSLTLSCSYIICSGEQAPQLQLPGDATFLSLTVDQSGFPTRFQFI